MHPVNLQSFIKSQQQQHQQPSVGSQPSRPLPPPQMSMGMDGGRFPDDVSANQAAQLYRMHMAQNGVGGMQATPRFIPAMKNGGQGGQTSQNAVVMDSASWKYKQQSRVPAAQEFVGNKNNGQPASAASMLANERSNVQQKMMMPLSGLANMVANQQQQQPQQKLQQPPSIPVTTAQNPLNEVRLSFGVYWPDDVVKQFALLGLIIMGPIRINQRDYTQSFVPHPTQDIDVAIPGVTLRNGALNGDIVAVQIISSEKIVSFMPTAEAQQFINNFINNNNNNDSGNGNNVGDFNGSPNDDAPDRTAILTEPIEEVSKSTLTSQSQVQYGRVVAIMRKVHPRVCAGTLRRAPTVAGGEDQAFLLSPVDHRIPRLIVPSAGIPASIRQSISRYNDMMFVANIIDWPDVRFARGQLRQQLGIAGDLKTESDAILWSIGVDPECIDFGPDVEASLPAADWTPSAEEVSRRLDLRQSCIFTCDPATARDLDDAISIEFLPCGIFEVGVHIADVSYFVAEGSLLDAQARTRATSVYLVERMVPMLPERLSSNLCSLNPGVDRLTFSVIWHLDRGGNVLSEWIGRTVINSCCKLNYEVAQDIIDGVLTIGSDGCLEGSADSTKLPEVHGSFSWKHIFERLQWLFPITQALRQRRKASGAISLDQIKLKFALADDKGQPVGFSPYRRLASNELIEELMLLANMAVARKINTRYPDLAVLRRHPAPQKSCSDKLVQRFSKLGVPIDFSTSGTLSASLNRLQGTIRTFLLNSVIRINQMAVYFRADCSKSSTFARHYALACDCYTHYTSPIRRYADILVHRQLAAACYGTCSPGEQLDLDRILRICNERKQLAKMASEESSRLYYAALVRECGPMSERGIVVGVLDRCFDVLVIRTGMIARVYVDVLFSLFEPTWSAGEGGKDGDVKKKAGEQVSKQNKNSNNLVRFSQPEEALEIQLYVPLQRLQELQQEFEQKQSADEGVASPQPISYIKQRKMSEDAALLLLVIRPMTVVSLIVRHSPTKSDPLKWETILDPSEFVQPSNN